MRKKKITHRKRILAGLMATGLALYFGSKLINVPSYTAIRVFDGDTFETREKQYIRVSGIDTPELGMCGSEEAKQALEQLVLNKKLYIKVLYHQGARSNGLVYSSEGLISTAMLVSGWAVLNDRDNVDLPELTDAAKQAKAAKRGLFSELCTQTVNKEKPSCVIKGNIRSNEKTYHTPDCKSYKTTEIQLYNGDTWFCTEKQAKEAGFVKATQCALGSQ